MRWEDYLRQSLVFCLTMEEQLYSMRWFPLAKTEFDTILSSNGSWLLVALLPVYMYRPSYIVARNIGQNITIGYIQYIGTLLLPLAIILLAYRSIVGERESGSIKFLLGLPLSRTDVFLGKFIGRAAGLTVITLLGIGIGTIIGIARHGLFSPLKFLAVLLVTVVYIVALVSIVVSVSTVSSQPSTSAGVLVAGFLIVLELAWESVAQVIIDLLLSIPILNSKISSTGLWFLLARLTPSGAYNVVTNWILGIGNSANLHNVVLIELQPSSSAGAYVVANAFSQSPVPVYLHESAGLIILVLWIIIPARIALYSFTREDLL